MAPAHASLLTVSSLCRPDLNFIENSSVSKYTSSALPRFFSEKIIDLFHSSGFIFLERSMNMSSFYAGFEISFAFSKITANL